MYIYNTSIINIFSGYNIAMYNKMNVTVMILHVVVGYCTFMIAWLVFTITNNYSKQIIADFEVINNRSLYGSRVYIGMYIPDWMISDNNCFYYN